MLKNTLWIRMKRTVMLMKKGKLNYFFHIEMINSKEVFTYFPHRYNVMDDEDLGEEDGISGMDGDVKVIQCNLRIK